MKRKLVFSFLIMVIITLSMSLVNKKQQSQKIVHINIEKSLGNKKDIKYSEIIESLRFVRLETTEKALIGSTRNLSTSVLPLKEHFLVSQENAPPILFDKNGKYLRTISSFGRGPSELSEDYTVAFNTSDQNLYILSNFGRVIRVFNLEGKHIRDVKTEPLHTFQTLGNNRFCGAITTNVLDKSRSYNYIVFNEKGETLHKHKIHGYADMMLAGSTPEMVLGYNLSPLITVSRSGVQINTFQNDTIFTIKPDGSLHHSISWTAGKYKSPFKQEDMVDLNQAVRDKYLSIMLVAETKKYWILNSRLNRESTSWIYDKSTGDSFEFGKLVNDTEEAFTVMPREHFIYGNTCTFMFEVLDLKRMIQSDAFKQAENELPKKTREFIEMVNSLKNDDNPVLIIMNLK